MANDQDVFSLPVAPRGLCFEKNDFLKSSFSVDSFLHDHRNVNSFESMRDDLGAYLKTLRLAMIELINKDYANFVNLSATLIGLDKAILGIQSPLGQLHEEVLLIKKCLEDAIQDLSLKLEQREALRHKRKILQYYAQSIKSLSCLKSMLKIYTKHVSKEVPVNVIDRAANQYNQLHFTMSRCNSHMSVDNKRLCVEIGDILFHTLSQLFLNHLKNNCDTGMIRTLQTFASLDRVASVESLIRRQVVSPAMDVIISESALRKSDNGVKGIYSKILLFLDNDLKLLLSITQCRNGKLPAAKGYNFLVNSFWVEVEMRLELHMSSLFAPGDPMVFHSRYVESMKFLKSLEQYCHSDSEALKLFQMSQQLKSFHKQWSLPIYFEIRFQEISGSYETTLMQSLDQQISEEMTDSEFLLKSTASCFSHLELCWNEQVFLTPLAHKFWKLSLQILSRYNMWVSSKCVQISAQENAPEKKNDAILKFFLFLYIDINRLINKFPILLNMVKAWYSHLINVVILEDSLQPCLSDLINHLPVIKNFVVNEVHNQCKVFFKQVTDIPRLYMKTNRNVPTVACTYLVAVLTFIRDFKTQYQSVLSNTVLLEWIQSIFSINTIMYYDLVSEVLTTVQKTEESIRRLNKMKMSMQIRDRPATVTAVETTSISDDNKIRLQLNVDVKTYVEAIENLNLNKLDISKLDELIILVENAVRGIEIKQHVNI